jgi:uncharacterized protein (TIGR02284 family)
METNSKLRSSIDDLIQICRDGQEGFRTAAENTDDAQFRQIFSKYSQQRAQFAGELQSAAHSLGESKPENDSSVVGTLHRGWIDLKGAIAGKDPHAILSECERGEDSAVESYKKALELEWPADLRTLVQRQSAAVQSAHDEVKALRDSLAPAK